MRTVDFENKAFDLF